MAQALNRAYPAGTAGMLAGFLFLMGPGNLSGQAPEANPAPAPERLVLLEAVRRTLAQDANIRLSQEQVEIAKGAVQSAAGQFDITLDSALERGLARVPRTQLERLDIPGYTNVEETVTDITTYDLRVRKQFRSGITLSPGLALTRYTDNLDQERAVNRANVSFLIRVPLLKDAGRAATGALERAARADQEAAVLELEHAIAGRIFNTVLAYWTCLGAQGELRVLEEMEADALELVEAVSEVVRINELAVSELRQAEADLAAKRAARMAGQQSYRQAQQQLAQAMGMALEQIAAPPVPEDDFPDPAADLHSPSVEASRVLAHSLNRRADYQAALKVRQAAEILARAARRNVKPRLDLDLEVGYAALEEGSHLRHFFGTLDPRLAAGPNLLGSLVLEWPIANQSARGLLVQREAAQRQSELRLEELARTIHSGILIAWSEVSLTRGELAQSELAIQMFRQAVDGQQDKVRLGTATILDLITLTDRLNAAELNAISARARYAVALARVRFETGRLVARGVTIASPLSLEDLTTLPDWD